MPGNADTHNFLGFFGGAADVRRGQQIGRGEDRIALFSRLRVKHVEPGAGDFAGFKTCDECGLID